MVTQYGMSEKFGLIGLESVESQYLDGRPVLNCADETAADVDKEVMALLKASYEKAKKQIEEHKEKLLEIADFLIEKETITGKEFMRIFKGESTEDAEKTETAENAEEIKPVQTAEATENAVAVENTDSPKETENV